MSDIQLRRFFGFDDKDLDANRAGVLSARQETRLREAEEGANRFFFWTGVVLILTALVISLFMIRNAAGGSWDVAAISDWGNLLSGLAVAWGICGFLAVGSFRLAGSKLDYSVQKAEGRINFVKVEKQVRNPPNSAVEYRTEQQYELRVGRVAFEDVDEELLNIIEEGDIYAFYYTKGAKEILSCEYISRGK